MVGQKLKVVSSGETASLQTKETSNGPAVKPSNGSKTSGSSQNKYTWYTIQPGDNLWDIANKFDGVTVAQIKSLNNITNANHLKAGQRIRIPVAK